MSYCSSDCRSAVGDLRVADVEAFLRLMVVLRSSTQTADCKYWMQTAHVTLCQKSHVQDCKSVPFFNTLSSAANNRTRWSWNTLKIAHICHHHCSKCRQFSPFKLENLHTPVHGHKLVHGEEAWAAKMEAITIHCIIVSHCEVIRFGLHGLPLTCILF